MSSATSSDAETLGSKDEKDDIERDTAASEDCAVELLPDGKFPTACDLFSITVRNAALRGWVKQPSPCCAASAIAGCFNTIRNVERNAEAAVSHADVISVMDGQLDDDKATKQASVARLLGLPDASALSALERRVGAIQDEKGRPMESRKKEALKPPDLRAAVREAAQRFATGAYPDADAAEAKLWTSLGEVYAAADAAKAAGASETEGVVVLEKENSRRGATADGATEVAAEEEEDEGSTGDVAAAACGGIGADGSAAIALQKDVNKAIVSALQVHIGQLKLRAEHPSTAFFGNGDVLKAVRRLSDTLGVNIVGRNFCGRDVRGASNLPLKRDESEEAQEAQWRQLVAEFMRSDTALILHMSNHYCMVYGAREWVEPETASSTPSSTEASNPASALEKMLERRMQPAAAEEPAKHAGVKRVRQLLSAKPGQRPSKWLDWDDLRKTMLGWAGYKVLALRLEG
jgi:hypothetical protein